MKADKLADKLAGSRSHRTGWVIGLLLLIGVFLSSCSEPAQESITVPNGDADRGRTALKTYGCGTCHTIPGIVDADAVVGPPLDRWSERIYIAGLMRNNPDNLIQWIQDPQSFEPGTVMPDMNVSEPDARDMAAYLFTLR